jgi:transcriptional regulator with XRE-family HTH domain
MRTIESPVVQRDLTGLSAAERREYLDILRYEGIYDEIATTMRILLRAAGRTQRAVAEAMGTSETALSRLLSGRSVRTARFDTLVRFAKALDVDVADLFGDPEATVSAMHKPPGAAKVDAQPASRARHTARRSRASRSGDGQPVHETRP